MTGVAGAFLPATHVSAAAAAAAAAAAKLACKQASRVTLPFLMRRELPSKKQESLLLRFFPPQKSGRRRTHTHSLASLACSQHGSLGFHVKQHLPQRLSPSPSHSGWSLASEFPPPKGCLPKAKCERERKREKDVFKISIPCSCCQSPVALWSSSAHASGRSRGVTSAYTTHKRSRTQLLAFTRTYTDTASLVS